MIKSLSRVFIALFFIIYFAVVLPVNYASAVTAGSSSTDDCSEAKLRAIGVTVSTCSGYTPCKPGGGVNFVNNNSADQQKKVFVIGDSLTLGMVSGGLLQKLKDKTYDIQASWDQLEEDDNIKPTYRGASVEATGGINVAGTATKLRSRALDLKDVDLFIIALGTNNDSDFPSAATSLLDLLPDSVSKENILWVNTYFSGDYEGRNTAIQAASADKFTVIDIASAVQAAEVQAPNGGDGIHYSPEGYKLRSTWLADKIVAQQSGISASTEGVSPTGGCECPASSTPVETGVSDQERYRSAWGFLTSPAGMGLTPAAAAGLMGNLEAESGINPINMQNDAPLPDGPELPTEIEPETGQRVVHSAIRGRYGYGIAQWTTAGRQTGLMNFAVEKNMSSGSMNLQLEFLKKELVERYAGVLAVLQKPTVTVNEASDEVLLRFEIPASVILPPRGDSTPEKKAASMRARAERGQRILNEYGGQSISYVANESSCAGVSGGAEGLINPDDPNQANAPCASGTTEVGIIDGYRNGQPVKIKTCSVEDGLEVNAQVSGQVSAMFRDARAAGVNLTANSFRSLEDQISRYIEVCGEKGIPPSSGPFPYPEQSSFKDPTKANAARYCPGVANPGYSNHGMGFALDIACDDRLIDQTYASAKNNKCWQWLNQNAQKYGFYEYGKGAETSRNNIAAYEGWHWSINGG